MSSQAPCSWCCPSCTRSLQHYGIQDRRGVLQHPACPRSPPEDEKTTALPHLEIPEIPVGHTCSLTTGLPSTPNDLPSLRSSFFRSLPPHFWALPNLGSAGAWPCPPLPGKARPLLDRAKVWIWIETLPCRVIPIVLEWIFLSQNLLSSTGVAQIFPLAISP